MKSSTLMVILLVVQAVLIMGVFAVVPIENSAVAGEDEVTANPPCPGNPPFCKNCTVPAVNGSRKCQDEVPGDWKSCRDNTKCMTCTEVHRYKVYYKCNDDFISGTCCNTN